VVSQGNIETSNVDPVKEMVGLISTQRAYESFQRVIKSFNDTYGQSIRNVGTV
ncbi:MAG: flagellar basal body and hook protein, partial [Deltaproteobacteria bacterium]|nr:flagellar basal body and hook protein [Deltaproteobacteria bacterium]